MSTIKDRERLDPLTSRALEDYRTAVQVYEAAIYDPGADADDLERLRVALDRAGEALLAAVTAAALGSGLRREDVG